MKTKTLVIEQLSRTPDNGLGETLTFEPGVNVIIGPPNSGKTKWLDMLDFLMGDRSSARHALGDILYDKYRAVQAVIRIDGEQIFLERRWKEQGLATKVLIDSEPVDVVDFSGFMLDKLSIPQLHYPKGNPFAQRSWPELSWRSLLRHIYRQQRFWGDIAPQQPASEQHACLMLILGVAELLFSDDFGHLVELNKQLNSAESAKEQFNSLFSELYQYITEDGGITVAPTSESIETAIKQLATSIDKKVTQRDAVLEDLLNEAHQDQGESDVQQLSSEWESLQLQRQENEKLLAESEARLEDLHAYQQVSNRELNRLQRAQKTGFVLADLQVTHCPACDQPVTRHRFDDDKCFLCRQPTEESPEAATAALERLEFEEEQLRGDVDEMVRLINSVSSGRDQQQSIQRQIDDRLKATEMALQPLRQAAAAIIPPMISRLDKEIGALQERRRVLDRLGALRSASQDRSVQIDKLRGEIRVLGDRLDETASTYQLETKGDALADGMNDYLTVLNQPGEIVWSQAPISVQLREKAFSIRVGNEAWSTRLGGTLTNYFLLAYQYSLMRMSNQSGYHYPGLLILDFPAPVENAETIADKENFVVEPFVNLLRRNEMRSTQVIAAGAAFEGLHGVHRIELDTVWVD